MSRWIKWDTVLTTLLIALVLGVFNSIINDQKTSADGRKALRVALDNYALGVSNIVVKQRIAAEKMLQVQATLAVIKDGIADRYTRQDAAADRERTDNSIQQLDSRVRSIERKIDRSLKDE